MVKLVVAYKKTKDANEFERLYEEEHLPLAARIPHRTRPGGRGALPLNEGV